METARLNPAETDAAVALDLYRRMLLIRRVEDRVQALFLRGEVYGTTHLYSGQEAVAVGFASALRDGTASRARTAGTGTAGARARARRGSSPSCSAARPA